MCPGATQAVARTTYQGQRNPRAHESADYGIRARPLVGEEGGETFARGNGLLPLHSINRIYQRSELAALLNAVLQVYPFLLSLLVRENGRGSSVSMGFGVRVADTDVEDGGGVGNPKAMDSNITTLFLLTALYFTYLKVLLQWNTLLFIFLGAIWVPQIVLNAYKIQKTAPPTISYMVSI